MFTTTTRPAAVAGLFYPDDAEALRAEVRAALAGARPAPSAAAPKMLLVPHAGYVYSGPIAGSGYALLAPWAERIRRVVLLGPTHRVALRGLAAPTVDAFETPLGRVPLDRAALDTLVALPQVTRSDAPHAREHSLEVQLPFLQAVLDEFTLVPLAVGDAAPEAVAEVLERLWGGDETLIVISSDLSHYLPYDEARAADRATVERILAFATDLDPYEACGAHPLAGALRAARAHGLVPRLLDLRNSGDTAGDRERVVGYAALAFEPAAAATHERDDELGQALLARARNTIAAALGRAVAPEPPHPALARPGATFVTLHVHGELRGCIGTLEACRALEADVRRHARAAAFEDTRFESIRAHELEALQVEVSLLGASEPLPVAGEHEAHARLRPGVDGVTLRWRGRSATFLPQVWEQLPAPRDFLAALKRKAGLPADFWAEDVLLERYAVRKFGVER
ncbi:MAG: AmmeMemoRadiSam system protein B [Piscinibacter sp.]|uniref:AmmeMemoRadiSam system protein B n=1 Tax=Piscinibacter sp. TaxID=1903157 RepID=UPI00258CBF3C|nr:AmmeMemoRadiSam system protein B [Piscinibacter sp.]MCW5664998.1 AmmeMemoRadiSam system protein B [Piscinibacter sp.]